MDLPTPNIPLLRKAVEWAEAEAAKGENSLWRQDDYVRETDCGTAYCVAGYVVAISPGSQIRKHGWPLLDGKEMSFAQAGQRLLGLTGDEQNELFYDWNDIKTVREVAEQIAARAGERL